MVIILRLASTQNLPGLHRDILRSYLLQSSELYIQQDYTAR